MKKILIIFLAFFLIACNSETPQVKEVIEKRVQVLEVSEKSYEDYESYVGHVESTGNLKSSFEVDGKLNAIYVAVGDSVKAGDLIASVDTEGLQYALDAARAELAAARSQLNKAEESLEFTEDLYNKTKELYKNGVSSKNEYDQVKLNYDVTISEVSSARQLVNQAITGVEVKEYMLSNSDLYADKDGVVVDVLYEVGELIPTGYPVIVLRDQMPIVSFGVSADDLAYVALDDVLSFEFNNKTYEGQVVHIEQIPDRQTQTYKVEMSMKTSLPLGGIVDITLPTNKIKGYKIPLGAIRSDGEDYVFIVNDTYAERINIKVLSIYNQEVIVEGLSGHVELIVEGILGLAAGDLIMVVEE